VLGSIKTFSSAEDSGFLFLVLCSGVNDSSWFEGRWGICNPPSQHKSTEDRILNTSAVETNVTFVDIYFRTLNFLL
jgi:hypothetical protein